MNTVLFNIHDVVLIVIVYQCMLLAVVMFLNERENRLSNTFLLLFLFANAIIPLDTLISFGAAFRGWAIDHLPNWFYVFEIGYWVQGPFLLWYLRSRIYKNFQLRGVDLFYLAPVLLAVFHQVLAYHSLPTAVKINIQQEYNLADETFTIQFVTLARELLRFYFGVLCVLEVNHYARELRLKSAGSDSLVFWLRVAVGSFAGLWGWACIVAIGLILDVHYHMWLRVGLMGLAANYGTCLMMSGLLIVIGRSAYAGVVLPKISVRAEVAQRVSADVQLHTPEQAQSGGGKSEARMQVNPEYVRKLDELMQIHKIYMDPELGSEVLAKELSVSPRTLSTILNRHYGCNFFEYINQYRIEEVKSMLQNPEYRDATMLDIMNKAGFNSKATFNNFFKKYEGMTPREYKKAHLAADTE